MRFIITSICAVFIFTLAGCKPGVYYSPKPHTVTTYNAQGQKIEKPRPKPVVGQPLVNFSDPNR